MKLKRELGVYGKHNVALQNTSKQTYSVEGFFLN